jgi:hypothetical protein
LVRVSFRYLKRDDMARCPHHNVQQFTEICLDCGRNIYESDEEYLDDLIKRKEQKDRKRRSDAIERLEKDLGIEHPGNRQDDQSQHSW